MKDSGIKETEIDKLLKIQTVGRDDYNADDYHHPYEPTPYVVLQRLAEAEYISRENIVIDYGCGKGRVSFYLATHIGCRTIGMEYDERIYEVACRNLTTFSGKCKPEFFCAAAEEYPIAEEDCFYFFNPFTVEILQAVIAKIIDSYYAEPRKMQLFFYYPDKDYVAYLMTKSELMFVDEITCEDLFAGKNDRERILIFEVVG